MDGQESKRFPRGLIDLHLHMDGSLSPAIARRLLQLQGEPGEESDRALAAKLQVGERCRDLTEYLAKFDYPLSLLQTREQLSECAFLLKEELRDRGLLYAELRFAPQSHRRKGLTQEEAVQSVITGAARSALPSGLILCCMRGADNEAENRETVRLAAKYLGQGVCAVDLAGAEGLFPTADYGELFAYARALGVPYTLHAGEGAGPESVRAALALGARRIGHGVRAAEDAALLRELAQRGAVLELCPTSNLQTGIFKDYGDFPLRRLLDAGVRVTVNSDNMAVSHTSVGEELQRMAAVFALTEQEQTALLLQAVEAAFTDEETKQRLRESLKEERT